VQDRYFYFDTSVEPAYIAMWRNDLPGDVGPWPPPGELAGVGVFTLLLVVGLGAAVALAGGGPPCWWSRC
jgi:galactan 5-O-arabinofuranosyltransferase